MDGWHACIHIFHSTKGEEGRNDDCRSMYAARKERYQYRPFFTWMYQVRDRKDFGFLATYLFSNSECIPKIMTVLVKGNVLLPLFEVE